SAFRTIYAKGTSNLDEAHRVEQRYLLLALDRLDQLPADLELLLVMRQRAYVFSTHSHDRNEVHKKLDVLFHAWRRMERETDPNFNPDAKPVNDGATPIDVLLRARVGWFSGMDPALISDPKVRDEYLAATKKESIQHDA